MATFVFVANAATLSTTEQAIVDDLTSLGHTQVLAGSFDTGTRSTTGADVVIIGPEGSSSGLLNWTNDAKAAAKPMLVWQHNLWDEADCYPAATSGQTAVGTAGSVENHPITILAGLTPTTTYSIASALAGSDRGVNTGALANDVAVVWNDNSGSGRAFMAALESGDVGVSGATANSRRVIIGINSGTWGLYRSADALAMLDASMEWLAGANPGGGGEASVVVPAAAIVTVTPRVPTVAAGTAGVVTVPAAAVMTVTTYEGAGTVSPVVVVDSIAALSVVTHDGDVVYSSQILAPTATLTFGYPVATPVAGGAAVVAPPTATLTFAYPTAAVSAAETSNVAAPTATLTFAYPTAAAAGASPTTVLAPKAAITVTTPVPTVTALQIANVLAAAATLVISTKRPRVSNGTQTGVQGISIGDEPVVALFVGDQEVIAVYIGDQLVYDGV